MTNEASWLPAIVTAVISAIALGFGVVLTFVTNDRSRRLALETEADGRFDKALGNLYAPQASTRSGAAYSIEQMALPSASRSERYFPVAFYTLCSVVRFDDDIYFIDVVFDILKKLRSRAQPAELSALSELKSYVEDDLIRHIGEYVAADKKLHGAKDASDAFQSLATTAAEYEREVKMVLQRDKREIDVQLRFADKFGSRDDGDLQSKAWRVRIDCLILDRIAGGAGSVVQ